MPATVPANQHEGIDYLLRQRLGREPTEAERAAALDRYRTRTSHPCSYGCEGGFFVVEGVLESRLEKCVHCAGTGIEPTLEDIEADQGQGFSKKARRQRRQMTYEERRARLPYRDD